MAKFIGILGSIFLIASFVTLIWPRVTPNPRPQPLQELRDLLMKTPVGQSAANVLGVSDDHTVLPITPQTISQQLMNTVHLRVSDVVITHAVREITKRFRDLPLQDQQKVLEEFSKAVTEPTPSPSEQLPEPSQNSTETNNNP